MKGARRPAPITAPKGAKKTTAPKAASGKKARAPKASAAGTTDPFSPAGKLSRLRLFAAEINKRLKQNGAVMVGADIQELEYDYVRTGNPAFDFVTNGGFIRGRITELWGLEGTSKTTFLAQAFRHLQSQGLVCALVPIEGIDKGWWRTNGVYIPYGTKEIARLRDAEQRRKAEKYNAHYEKLGWAPLIVVQTRAGDQALQIVYEIVKKNVVDIVGVDSLGAVKRSRILEEKDLTDPSEHGGEASLFSNFCDFLYSAQNTRYDDDGNPDPFGTHANKTIVACINQARVSMGVSPRVYAEYKRFHPKGGQALRHAWSQSVFFRDLNDDQTTIVKMDGHDRHRIYAKTFEIFGTKMRGGPEGRVGRFTLYIANHLEKTKGGIYIPFRAGTLDTAASVRALATQLGIVTQQGAWYSLETEAVQGRWNGKEAFDDAIRSDEDLFQHLYDVVIEKAREDACVGVVPEID